ncbi:MAG: FAD-binding oxidoreductase [Leptolyngbya sp. UWPOB_LEPTO1]|uniref:FAD-binding oxidoreductase n=1 Tax=Leptolyngbya sp. UWPOB_LEPTO1 TaxID=2815653 RepID=UPI001AC43E4C|nr:FAD-binding oxidoreductase [Leptolyngbya sp. UWPOB_LEPTO1]MBN8559240.1 FAD-binding oxidoreductase [Leptolyngbya sp. UWPOB_LEPTO1]
MQAVLQTLGAISEIRSWQDLTECQQTQLSRSLVHPDRIYWVSPATIEELGAIVACAYQHQWRILPCGHATKLHWGGVIDEVTLVVSTEKLDRLVEHAEGDLTVTTEVGISFAQLQAIVGKVGQFCAIDPQFRDRATLGGIIATADTGSLRHRYNSVRDMLLGITFVRYDGEIVKAGGRVVKNVAGYDLMKLLTGSYGTLGILAQATLRVYPIPANTRSILVYGDSDSLAQAAQTLLSSALTPTSVDLLSNSLTEKSTVGLLVRFQSIPESVNLQIQRLTEVATALGLSVSDADLWQTFHDRMDVSDQRNTIVCKIGVRPSSAVTVLDQLASILPAAKVVIHAASGIGQLSVPDARSTQILEARSICAASGGYLSVLQGSIAFKQQLDVWGYSGNALNVMQRVKAQFDPQTLFSPHRFVGGI